MIKNFSIWLATETEKYRFMKIARSAGAKITGVSGCGSGYYIQLDATPETSAEIDRNFNAEE